MSLSLLATTVPISTGLVMAYFGWQSLKDIRLVHAVRLWAIGSKPRHKCFTLIDCGTIEETTALVKCVSKEGQSSEELVDWLYKLFQTFPPDEQTLIRLSLFEQELRGHGGAEEFAIVTVYSVCMAAVTDVLPRDICIRRSHTCGVVLLPECVGTINDGESPAAVPASTPIRSGDDGDDGESPVAVSTLPDRIEISQETEKALREEFEELGDRLASGDNTSAYERGRFEAIQELINDIDKTRTGEFGLHPS